MSTEATAIRGRVLLVSAPWPLFNRPSLPLGALKAYLSTQLPHVRVDASHFFLQVAHALGYDRYHTISQRVWRAEAVFSALLYPEHARHIESLYASTFKRGDGNSAEFQQLVAQVKTLSDQWLREIDWTVLDLAGFSISFCQVTASLYLISRIKAICPSLPVVVGGSSFSGERSDDLLKTFPCIDYLVMGEGERPLTDLLRLLLNSRLSSQLDQLPNGVLSSGSRTANRNRFSQLRSMDCLTMPDYNDYFKLLAGFSPQRRFFPTLPVEASRGCWWQHEDAGGRFRGCAFCNLNLQWKGYRTKPADQVVREVDQLVSRHQVLSLAFADNALPAKQAGPIFDGIGSLGKELSIFAELRADIPMSLIRKMKLAGVDTLQVGVEALSDRLLVKMNKGVRVIDNLCLMKHCEAAGIVNAANLMLHFPGSDSNDVEETLRNLTFARWYRPLKTVSFWLGLDSPVYRFARQFQMQSVFNHPNLKKLFPASVAAGFRFMIQGYRGDRTRQQRLWRPVEKITRQWRKEYETMQRQTGGRPALTYRDGGRFLIIDQCLSAQPTARHRLTGVSAKLYRFCSIPRTFDQVAGTFRANNPQQIRAFFQSMLDKRLMFAEADSYLSLALPIGWPC